MNRLTFIFFFWMLAGLGLYAQTTTMHTVKRGESFASIAKHYGITEEQLKAANPNNTVCYVGLNLALPAVEPSQQTVADATSSADTSAATDSQIAQAEKPHKKKKKKKFWKNVGNFFSGLGDVVVAVADGMSESELLDETGNVGTLVGGTADIVNMTRGGQSNYLGEATNGEYNTVENTNIPSAESDDISSTASQLGDVNVLRREMDAIDKQINELSQQQIALSKERMENNTKMAGKSRAAASSTLGSSRDASRNFSPSRAKAKSKVVAKAQQPYKSKQNSIDREIKQIEEKKNALYKKRGEIETQIAEIEGTQEELAAKRAAIKAKNKELAAKNKQKLKEIQEQKNANSPSARLATDLARDNMVDMETNTEKWIDTYGVEGTIDKYEESYEVVKQNEEKRKGKKK